MHVYSLATLVGQSEQSMSGVNAQLRLDKRGGMFYSRASQALGCESLRERNNSSKGGCVLN